MVQLLLPSRRVSTLKGCHHAVVECLPLRLSGCLLPRTSQNSSSRTLASGSSSLFSLVAVGGRRGPDRLRWFAGLQWPQCISGTLNVVSVIVVPLRIPGVSHLLRDRLNKTADSDFGTVSRRYSRR